MKPFRILASLLFVCSLGFCVFGQTKELGRSDLKKLGRLMAGEFSSEEQSKADSTFFHIKLRMKPIWKDRKDGIWLYVEQSAAESEDKPYRQRIYKVYLQDNTTLVSKVYEMPEPLKYTGAWKDVSKLNGLSPESLIDRQGCSIYLKRNADKTFGGLTPGKECLSSLRGATYATSEVTIYDDRLISWDRGWNAEDKQVWGAVKSGYIFKKIKNLD